MYFTTDGIILRETAYRDADKLLTVLTADRGQLTLRARGVRSRRSPLKAACQLLAFSEFTVFESRGRMTVNEADPKLLFMGLRANLELLALASYFAQVAELVSQEDSPSPELLRLLINALYALDARGRPQRLVKAAFELRVACLAGFTPNLSGCASCGSGATVIFNLSDGSLRCEDCAGAEGNAFCLPVRPGTLAAMRHIVDCEPGRLFSFRLGGESAAGLSELAENYLLTQFERGFAALDFYKTLL